MDITFNVVSAAGLPGPVDQFYLRFEGSGIPEEQWPDDEGWMTTDRFLGQTVGRIAIRDELNRRVVERIGRDDSYSRQHQWNLMVEARVLEEHCEWPVQSLPAIYDNSLQVIAGELVADKPRRNRKPQTDCTSGANVSGA